jgi:hypothetical protein
MLCGSRGDRARLTGARNLFYHAARAAVHDARMRSSVTSTSLTPRKLNSSRTRYFGGSSCVRRTIFPTAAVTAWWKSTSPTCIPARFTRTDCPGSNIATLSPKRPSRRWQRPQYQIQRESAQSRPGILPAIGYLTSARISSFALIASFSGENGSVKSNVLCGPRHVSQPRSMGLPLL